MNIKILRNKTILELELNEEITSRLLPNDLISLDRNSIEALHELLQILIKAGGSLKFEYVVGNTGSIAIFNKINLLI